MTRASSGAFTSEAGPTLSIRSPRTSTTQSSCVVGSAPSKTRPGFSRIGRGVSANALPHENVNTSTSGTARRMRFSFRCSPLTYSHTHHSAEFHYFGKKLLAKRRLIYKNIRVGLWCLTGLLHGGTAHVQSCFCTDRPGRQPGEGSA